MSVFVQPRGKNKLRVSAPRETEARGQLTTAAVCGTEMALARCALRKGPDAWGASTARSTIGAGAVAPRETEMGAKAAREEIMSCTLFDTNLLKAV
jgi:hypothetical protein